MRDLKRRRVLQILGATPAVAALAFTEADAEQAATQSQAARRTAAAAGTAYKPKFFTASEYATVVALADLIIPKDERSGSASEAGAPEFVDHIVSVQPERQVAARGGLKWIDTESLRRFDKTFVQAADAQRRQILDDIAWPAKARPEMSQGVAFFTRMRDFTASGFYSSAMGWKDLDFVAPAAHPHWDGCPPAALQKLGVSYDLMDHRPNKG
jgi:gluconate 2-dehydrogenase gamma chain